MGVMKNKQTGMTLIGWLIVLGLIAFFALLGMKLFPMVMEDYEIGGSLESLKQEPFLTKKTNKEIISLLQRRFDVNDVTAVKQDNIKITKEGGVMIITIDYENQKPFMGNYYILGKYHHSTKVVED